MGNGVVGGVRYIVIPSGSTVGTATINLGFSPKACLATAFGANPEFLDTATQMLSSDTIELRIYAKTAVSSDTTRGVCWLAI